MCRQGRGQVNGRYCRGVADSFKIGGRTCIRLCTVMGTVVFRPFSMQPHARQNRHLNFVNVLPQRCVYKHVSQPVGLCNSMRHRVQLISTYIICILSLLLVCIQYITITLIIGEITVNNLR